MQRSATLACVAPADFEILGHGGDRHHGSHVQGLDGAVAVGLAAEIRTSEAPRLVVWRKPSGRFPRVERIASAAGGCILLTRPGLPADAMHVLDIDRVAILTEDIADSMERWNERLDLEFEHVNESEAGERIETTYSHPGIEFLSPATADGQLAERLEARGPGVHALVLRVADLDAAKAELAEDGLEPIMESDGEEMRAAFYSPREFDGVLLELTEYSHPMDGA